MGADAVTDGENGVEVVVIDQARYLAGALGLNYSEFPNSCPGVQFTLVVDVPEMLVDGRHRNPKELSDQGLREPDRLILEAAFDARPAVFGLIKDHFAAWGQRGRRHH